MAACFCVCTSVIRSSSQGSEHRSLTFGGQSPTSWMDQAALEIHAWLPAETGKGMDSYTTLRIEINCDLLSRPSPGSCKLLTRLQSSKIVTSERLCKYSFCLDREMGSQCFLLCCLPWSNFLLQTFCIFWNTYVYMLFWQKCTLEAYLELFHRNSLRKVEA